jgi:hypothetical protein
MVTSDANKARSPDGTGTGGRDGAVCFTVPAFFRSCICLHFSPGSWWSIRRSSPPADRVTPLSAPVSLLRNCSHLATLECPRPPPRSAPRAGSPLRPFPQTTCLHSCKSGGQLIMRHHCLSTTTNHAGVTPDTDFRQVANSEFHQRFSSREIQIRSNHHALRDHHLHALATLGILWRGMVGPPKRTESSKGPIKPLYRRPHSTPSPHVLLSSRPPPQQK